jgi:hypothetical protein
MPSLAAVAVTLFSTAALGDEGPAELRSDAGPAGVVAPSAESGRQPTATPTDTTPPPAKPEEIAAWITDLDDNRYLVRETATRRLLETGVSSLDPLLAVANGRRPEPADRAVWILRRFGAGKDQQLRRQALERLTLVQSRPQVAAAARNALIELRHKDAVEAIQQLGGRYDDSGEYTMAIGRHFLPRVVIDRQWRGRDEGMSHLRDLVAARTVVIIGADISAAGLAHLQHVNQLNDVVLYGTKLEPEDAEKLQKDLPGVEFDYRRGGLLGVAAVPAEETGPAAVGTVQRGSAAEAAGIKVGDIIQKFEDQPVPSFRALTDMIGDHRGGDEVTLEVMRGGQPIKFKVKLGEWQSADLAP